MPRTLICLLLCVFISPVAPAQERRPQFPLATQRARADLPGYTLIEGEQLVRGAVASSGAVTAQPMASFGPDWSGNAQLFWTPPSADSRSAPTLKTAFNVPAPGTYSILLRYTQAPDYGLMHVYIGRQLITELSGYSAQVRLAQTTFADRHLDSGPNELRIDVIGKPPKSTGYFVGIDALQLLLISPGTNLTTQNSNPAQQTAQPLIGPSAKLTFAVLSPTTLSFAAMGPLEKDLYEVGLGKQPFAWESNFAQAFEWRWQISTQPFAPQATLAGPGIVSQGLVSGTPFMIDFSKTAPLGKGPPGLKSAQAGGAATSARQASSTGRPGAMDLYVRLIPIKNDAPGGPPSNVVVAHYKLGQSAEQATLDKAVKEIGSANSFKQSMVGYSLSIESFTPAKWPHKIGCVIVVANKHSGELGHDLFGYPPRSEPYCPEKDPQFQDKDALWWIGQAFKGWLFAWEGAASYYNDAKAWVIDKAVGLIPCDSLGEKLETSCKSAVAAVVDSALTAAMASQGIPPTMPSLTQLEGAAEGDLLEAAVDFTCDQMTGEKECDALIEQGLHAAYSEGLEQLKKDAVRAGHEPDCQSQDLKDALMIPLPCFTDYPDTKVKPAPGAVYEPPLVKVKVTRTAPVPTPYLPCTLKASLSATNKFTGSSYVNGKKLDPKTLMGELYEPGSANIPLLKPGESATMTLALTRYRLFSIESNSSTPSGTLGEWAQLYWSGKATLLVASVGQLPKSLGGEMAPCSANASSSYTLPAKP